MAGEAEIVCLRQGIDILRDVYAMTERMDAGTWY